MKKNSIFSSLSHLLGIILGIIGIAFLGYSAYILFFLPEKEKLINILPEKNFEFILLAEDISKNIPQNISEQFPFPIPKTGAIASYFDTETNSSHFIHITPESSDSQTLNSLECKTTHHYKFCTTAKDSVTLYTITEAIDQKSPSLRSIELFTDEDSSFFEDASYSFAGKTSFLKKNISQFPIPLARDNNFFEYIFSLSEDALPYFSGNINDKNNTYSFELYKKNKKTIFPKGISKENISSAFIHPESDLYIYIQKPIFFLNFIQQNSQETSFPKVLSLYTKGKKWALSLFSNKASWEEDLEPLLATDILFTQSVFGTSFTTSLPSQETAQSFYSQFVTILTKISEENIPLKKGFPLTDGTMIYEIFPNKKDVTITSKKSDIGEFSIFTTKSEQEKETSEGFTVGTASKKSFLIFSDNEKNIQHFWTPSSKKSSFSIPKEKSLFFSFGFNSDESKGKRKNSTVLNAEIMGEETEDTLSFFGKIIWNPEFFTLPPVPTIEDLESENEENTEEIGESESTDKTLENK